MRRRIAGSMRGLCLIILPLLAYAAAPLSALEAADGRVRLTLNESSGRFSIACQTQGNNSVSLPLLAAQDPRTTVLSIVVGNKIYRMGESSEFSQKAERVSGGARFVWKSSFIQVVETFTFLHSQDSSVSTGVRIDLSLKNLSERDITAGARYLFDTYLGEPGGVHFRTSLLAQISRELSIAPVGSTAWWLSPLAGDKDQFGLQVMTSGNGITVPDRLVFANWKRLSDTNWAFEASAARDFNLLPYSVNDSAVAQYYEPRSVPRSGEVTITLALGLYSQAGYDVNSVVPVASTSAQELPTGVQKSLAEGQNAADTAQAARADLSAVNAILSAIDAKIDTSASVSEDEISMIESALKVLQDRSKRFAPAPGK
jgi:hypothetical protein